MPSLLFSATVPYPSGTATDVSHVRSWLSTLYLPCDVVIAWMSSKLTTGHEGAGTASATSAASRSSKKSAKSKPSTTSALSLVTLPSAAVVSWSANLTAALEALASHKAWAVADGDSVTTALVAQADKLVGPLFVCVKAVVEHLSHSKASKADGNDVVVDEQQLTADDIGEWAVTACSRAAYAHQSFQDLVSYLVPRWRACGVCVVVGRWFNRCVFVCMCVSRRMWCRSCVLVQCRRWSLCCSWRSPA